MIIVIIIIIVSVFPLKMTTLGEMSYQLGKISQWNIPVISPKSRVVYPTDLRGCCGRCILFRRQGFWDCWLSRKRGRPYDFPIGYVPMSSPKCKTFHVSPCLISWKRDDKIATTRFWQSQEQLLVDQNLTQYDAPKIEWLRFSDVNLWVHLVFYCKSSLPATWDIDMVEDPSWMWIFQKATHFHLVDVPGHLGMNENGASISNGRFSSGKWWLNFETSPAGYHPQG